MYFFFSPQKVFFLPVLKAGSKITEIKNKIYPLVSM